MLRWFPESRSTPGSCATLVGRTNHKIRTRSAYCLVYEKLQRFDLLWDAQGLKLGLYTTLQMPILTFALVPCHRSAFHTVLGFCFCFPLSFYRLPVERHLLLPSCFLKPREKLCPANAALFGILFCQLLSSMTKHSQMWFSLLLTWAQLYRRGWVRVTPTEQAAVTGWKKLTVWITIISDMSSSFLQCTAINPCPI